MIADTLRNQKYIYEEDIFYHSSCLIHHFKRDKVI